MGLDHVAFTRLFAACHTLTGRPHPPAVIADRAKHPGTGGSQLTARQLTDPPALPRLVAKVLRLQASGERSNSRLRFEPS